VSLKRGKYLLGGGTNAGAAMIAEGVQVVVCLCVGLCWCACGGGTRSVGCVRELLRCLKAEGVRDVQRMPPVVLSSNTQSWGCVGGVGGWALDFSSEKTGTGSNRKEGLIERQAMYRMNDTRIRTGHKHTTTPWGRAFPLHFNSRNGSHPMQPSRDRDVAPSKPLQLCQCTVP